MKKLALALGLVLVFLFSLSLKAVERFKPPIRIVTAEYTPYKRLAEPDLVKLFKKYNIAICLCVREDQLNQDLDHLYTVYEKEGLHILFSVSYTHLTLPTN